MAEQKTKPTKVSAAAFLAGVEGDERRKDCKTLVAMMRRVTGAKPVMWGPSIVGFGAYHYKYASGHEGDSCIAGFSPRKPALTIYIVGGFAGHEALLKKLGKHKTGGGCLYIKRLADVDLGLLEELVGASVERTRARYGKRA